jgi:hypothetical protein
VTWGPTWWDPWCDWWWRPVYVYHPVRPIHVTHVHHTYSPLPVARPAVHIAHREPACPFTHREAWEHLAAGDVGRALEAFACLAREHPYDGLPNIGYAMANALIGADDSAVVMMRGAVRVDAESLRYVPADGRIDEQIIALLERYSERATMVGQERDAMFMIAALRTILQDHSGAYFAATQAIAHGDDDQAAFALRDMLAGMLTEQMYRR